VSSSALAESLNNRGQTLEFRMCDLAGARWLEGLRLRPDDEVLTVPPETGWMFRRHIQTLIKEYPTVAQLISLPVDRVALAPKGNCSFDGPELIESVAHALAAGAISAHQKIDTDMAYEISKFGNGREPYSRVPELLASAGVYSCLPKKTCLEFSRWIHDVNKPAFEEEVSDMFGDEAVAVYSHAARILEIALDSVSIHDSDMCCWRSPENGESNVV
jgi:hypothetical protein